MIAPTDARASPAAQFFQSSPMDLDMSTHDRVIANAVNRKPLKLSTSPSTTDLPCEDRLFHTRDLTSTNRFLLLLDEKFGDETWNPHQ
jgi:hypothetical protein